MTAEVSLFGLYIPVALLAAALAATFNMGLSRILRQSAAHRWVWHPALFEACVFVILWAVIDLALAATPGDILSFP